MVFEGRTWRNDWSFGTAIFYITWIEMLNLSLSSSCAHHSHGLPLLPYIFRCYNNSLYFSAVYIGGTLSNIVHQPLKTRLIFLREKRSLSAQCTSSRLYIAMQYKNVENSYDITSNLTIKKCKIYIYI